MVESTSTKVFMHIPASGIHQNSEKPLYFLEYNLEFQSSVQNLQKKGTFYEVLHRNTLK